LLWDLNRAEPGCFPTIHLHTEVIKRQSIDFIKPQGEIIYFPISVTFASFINIANMAAVKEPYWRRFAQFHAFKKSRHFRNQVINSVEQGYF
jgi:hypothetical protein